MCIYYTMSSYNERPKIPEESHKVGSLHPRLRGLWAMESIMHFWELQREVRKEIKLLQ
jgi:hypothetical protein